MAFSIGSIVPLAVRLWIGAKVFRWREPNVVRVSYHRVIKGPCDPCELEAMQYVAEKTSIPVPKVYATHTHDGVLYIEMEYVKGTNMAVAWMTEGFLSAEQKKAIFGDIKHYVAELRDLVPPAQDLVASALQNASTDCRIGSRFIKPCNHEHFHSLIRGNLPIENCAQFFGQEAADVHTWPYKTCFTHADLLPRNIIVRDGRVVAIVDWAFSGWYPEYWEFTKAHYDRFPRSDWYESLYEAIPRYDTELIAERSLWTKYDEPGNRRDSMYL